MKRLAKYLTALALTVLLCTQALAAGSAELIRAFVYDGVLYTYVAMEGTQSPITKADAKVGTQTFPASNKLETVEQAGFPVSYLLLVDNSTSMPAFGEDVVAFGENLAQNSGENTRYTLATFGDDFVVSAEDVTADELIAAMAALHYDENVTRLHTCIDKALDYFESIPRTGAELRCLVILSDAVQYDPAGETSYETLLERLSGSDVMLHSVGFGSDAADLESMGALVLASGGTHQVVGPALWAGDAAARLSAVSANLFVTGFDLTGCTTSGEGQTVSVTFASGGELVCKATAEVDIPAIGDQPPEEAPEAPLPPEEKPTAPQEPAQQVPAQTGGNEEEEQRGVPVLPIAIGGGVILAFLAVVMLLQKKKSAAGSVAHIEEPVQADQCSIYMRLEVMEGQLKSQATEFDLTHELLIGRGSECHITFDSQTISRQHARVFAADGVVYLEDMESQNGTFVNGNRIDMANRLHSGDVIAMGDIQFKLKF